MPLGCAGVYSVPKAPPGPGGWIGVLVAVLALTGVCGYFLATGVVTDSAAVLVAGIPGRVTVEHCDMQGRNAKAKGPRQCFGSFTSDSGAPQVVLSDVVIQDSGGFQPGQTLHGRVGGAGSNEVYPDGNLVELIPLTLFGGALLGLLTVLVRWPVRSVIHLWRPDIWPYRVWPAPVPRLVRVGARVAAVAGTVLALLFAVGIASGINAGIAIGLVVLILVMVGWVIIGRIRRARSAPGAPR